MYLFWDSKSAIQENEIAEERTPNCVKAHH